MQVHDRHGFVGAELRLEERRYWIPLRVAKRRDHLEATERLTATD
jgi:hypothetical protein